MAANTQKPVQAGAKPSGGSTTKQAGGAAKPASAKPSASGRK